MKKRPIITLGVFDGVHRGHREIFRQVIWRAKKLKTASLVYTFDPHPVKVLAPQACPLMINTIGQRVELIQEAGISEVVVQKFTKAFSQKTPEKFFKEIIIKELQAQEIFVGYNFTFGVRRSGTVEHLEKFGKAAGIPVHIVPPYLWDQTLVSSSQVRQFLKEGDLPKAKDLLARPYFMEGKVVRGKGRGGKKMGIHTANLNSENDLILPTGVYATFTRVDGKCYPSVTNIGLNPTFGKNPITIETHILDFSESVVSKRIHVEFIKKIRDEMSFRSSEELVAQIHKDIINSRKILSKHL